MVRMMLGLAAGLGIALAATGVAGAGDATPQKEIKELNRVTGLSPLEGLLKALADDKERAKEVVRYGLTRAKEKDGLSYNAALALAFLAADQKDLKASETFFRICMEKAAKLQSVNKVAQSYVRLIELYYADKKYADAARIARDLMDLKTDDAKDRVVLRAYTNEKGEYDTYEDKGFDTARRVKPVAQEYLVKALAKQGRHDQALKVLDGMTKDESDWRDEHLKGWVLREAGQFDKAAVAYENVIRRVSKDPDLDDKERDDLAEQLNYELSNVFVESKKIDRAAEQLEKLIKQNPDKPGYYNDLGYILADHDMKIDEAEKLVRKALELDKEKRQKRPNYDPKTDRDNGAYLDSLGWVLYKKKDYEGAKKYLQQAVEDKAAQHIEIYDHLGDVLLVLGERDAAVRACEAGLEHVGEGRRDQERKSAVEKKLEKAKQSK